MPFLSLLLWYTIQQLHVSLLLFCHTDGCRASCKKFLSFFCSHDPPGWGTYSLLVLDEVGLVRVLFPSSDEAHTKREGERRDRERSTVAAAPDFALRFLKLFYASRSKVSL